MELMVSLSALPPSIYRKFRKGWKPNPVLLGLFEKLSGKKGHKAMRIYIDAKTDTVIKNIAQSVKAPSIVEEALREKNIEIIDYVAGTGKDSHGRVVRIGRALKDPSAKKAFDSDPNRKSLTNATRNHQLICISMHPYDIAGMSTDRGWTSCMNLRGGSNKKYVKQDVANGVLVAYLIEPQDKNINKPIARALAKPYFEEQAKPKTKDKVVGGKVNALYLVDYAYPDSTMPFVHVLQKWFDEHINPHLAATKRSGLYVLHDNLYSDQRTDVYHHDLEGAVSAGEYGLFEQNLAQEIESGSMDTREITVLLNDLTERYPRVLASAWRAGFRNVAFYASAQRILAELNAVDALKALWSEMFKSGRPTSVLVSKSLGALYARKELYPLFISYFDEESQDEMYHELWNDTTVYSVDTNRQINGGAPEAFSAIWKFVSRMPDSEYEFWKAACCINDELAAKDFFEEYSPKSEEYLTEYLPFSLGTLCAYNTNDVPCVTRESLERNKKAVPEIYYTYAMQIFDGLKYLELDRRTAREKAKSKFMQQAKVSIDYASDAISDVDIAQLDVEVVKSLPMAITADFDPDTPPVKYFLVRSDETWNMLNGLYQERLVAAIMSELEIILKKAIDKHAKNPKAPNPYSFGDFEDDKEGHGWGHHMPDFSMDDDEEEDDD